MNKQQATQIIEFRKHDTPNLQSKKQEFFDWLNINFCDYGKPTKEKIECMESRYGDFDKKINYNPKLKSFEMWQLKNLVVKNYEGNPNTRTKVNSETTLEIDRLNYKKAFNIISEVCLSLIRSKYHFFVWYAKGQRSPHIRIYDLEEMQEFDPKQRVKAQILFWKGHVPFGCFQYVDTGIFVDEHPLQLEYAIHWKYGTPFELLFEYNPGTQRKTYPYPLMFFDGGIKFNQDRKTGKIAYAYVLINPSGEVIKKDCKLEDDSTTPKAEYKALILGLQEIQKRGLENVRIYGDSELIINQVLGKYRCDNESLKPLHKKVKSLMKNNKIKWIPREKNIIADKLTKEALKKFRKCKN